MTLENRGVKIKVLYVGQALPAHLESKVRQTKDLRSALATIKTEKFDLILVEREIEDGDGIVLAPTISRVQPGCSAILLTAQSGWATEEAALHLGYTAVAKKSELEVILERFMKRDRRASLPTEKMDREDVSHLHRLTIREREILSDLATGATTIEISALRHISVATTKSHLTSIYRKLEVRNRVEAISLLQR